MNNQAKHNSIAMMMTMTANIPTLLILLLWFAVFAASEHDTSRQLLHRRLGRDKEEKDDDNDDDEQPEPAPSLRPSTPDPTESPSMLATTGPPSPGPFDYLLDTATPPSIAPKPVAAPSPTTTATSSSVLPPALFHDVHQPTATSTPSPTSSSTTAPLSLNEKKRLLLVLNTWVDPSVLQVALRLFDASQQAEILATRSVPDGVAYELSVVDWTWVVDCTTTTSTITKAGGGGGGALDAYLRQSFPAEGYSSVAVSVVRIERLSSSASGGNSDLIQERDDQDGVTEQQQQMIILSLCLSAAVLCCCTGIALIFVPAYCQHRRQLAAEWSYDQDKERTLRGLATMEEEEESGTRSSH